jgi:hypothetical protein
MIRYTLRCDKEHEFEAWFASSKAFESQNRKKQVHCPRCGSHTVAKGMMAPNISPARKTAQKQLDAPTPEERADLARKIREHVEKTSENVGDKFADEARKIHNEEVEPRGIYGSATPDEAKELREEGVDFHPLPVLPEEKN